MARKGKDLFVMLAERHESRTTRQSAGRTSPASRGDTRKKVGTAGSQLGAAVGRAVRSVVRTFGQAEAEGETPKPPRSRSRGTRPRDIQRVPRGLLLPGWLLAAMVVCALGCGFLVGRFTSPSAPDEELNRSRGAVQTPGPLAEGGPGYLSPADAEQVLAQTFYVVKIFRHEAERGVAAELAQALRARGLHSTRIREFRPNGSFFCWATLCYVAPNLDQEAILADLRRYEAELGYEVNPVLQAPKGN